MAPARHILVWALAACLLLANGLVYPQTIPHAVHHAHHTAATHASVLCAWLCAAGQSLEGREPIYEGYVHSLGFTVLPPELPLLNPLSTFPTSRGPPWLLR